MEHRLGITALDLNHDQSMHHHNKAASVKVTSLFNCLSHNITRNAFLVIQHSSNYPPVFNGYFYRTTVKVGNALEKKPQRLLQHLTLTTFFGNNIDLTIRKETGISCREAILSYLVSQLLQLPEHYQSEHLNCLHQHSYFYRLILKKSIT